VVADESADDRPDYPCERRREEADALPARHHEAAERPQYEPYDDGGEQSPQSHTDQREHDEQDQQHHEQGQDHTPKVPPVALPAVKVRFAASLGTGAPDLGRLSTALVDAERMGFDTVWFSDVPMMASTDPMLAVAVAAATTDKVKVGANFVPFGHAPYVFARQLAQLDALTSGRLLVTLVPGLDQPGERQALGIGEAHRGHLLDELIPSLRRLWGGDGEVGLPVRPVQDPLEIWLGGSGQQAVDRAGRLADGWLGSLVSPDRAGAIREAIVHRASEAGRVIDPEHFGLSVAYARESGDLDRAVRLRTRPPVDLGEVVPVGRAALRDLVGRLVDAGLSKFVVRRVCPVESWTDELGWLADALLDLQT